MRSKGKLLGMIYGFPMYYMHYFVQCVFRQNVEKFIDIGEIGCTCIPKCNWTMVNLLKQTRFFMMLPVGVVLCMLGQYRVFPPVHSSTKVMAVFSLE